MAEIVDLSVFTFSTEEIRNINELILEDVLQAPEFKIIHTIYPNIVTDKFFGLLDEGGLVGLPNEGCDSLPQQWTIPGTQKKWTPKPWEVFLTECYSDLVTTMSIYSMNKGVDIGDLSNTDYMAIVVQVLSLAIKKMVWRFVWFGDTAADNYSNGGILTNGVNPDYFKLIDGLWKQLNVSAPTGNTKRVAIAPNAAASTSAQLTGLTGTLAYETLDAMWSQADIVLRSQPASNALPDKMFICTQSFADAYMKHLEGKDIESTYRNITDGIGALYFRGLPLIPIPVWDEIIMNYENNGTKLNNPHRCVLTTKSNLAVGVAADDVLGNVDVWYDKKEKRNYMRAMDSIDAKLLQEKLFVLAI